MIFMRMNPRAACPNKSVPYSITLISSFSFRLDFEYLSYKSIADENNHNLVLAVFTTLVSGVLTSFSSFIQN